MATALNYLDHLARESARFSAALAAAPDDARVPSCPDWDAVDLLWHLAEVQWFWGEVVERGVTDGRVANALKRPRPDDRASVQAAYDDASRRLGVVLAENPPDTPVWTWANDQSVGFIRRRQAHEALIHRVDAELAAGARTPLDPQLATDGVDEALRVMYGGVPSWGEFTPNGDQRVRVQTTDTGASWVLTLGRFTGTEPDGETSYTDEPDMRISDADDGAPAAATVRGTAADVDLWLWHREPLGPVERSGDEALLAELERTVAPGIN